MREKRDDKSRKSRAASSPRERKSGQSGRKRRDDSENPLHERTRSAQGKEKRGARRDFFTERNEDAPRSSQRRSDRRDDRKDSGRSSSRDNERNSYRNRNNRDGEQRSFSRYGSEKRSSDRDDRRKSSDRYSERSDRKDSGRGFDKDREKRPYRSRDDEQRSSSRYGNDRNDRRSGDRDNRGRSSDRFNRKDSDRRFNSDRERSSYGNRDGEQRSSSRFNSDRRSGDRDERRGSSERRSSGRFERDGQREERPFRERRDNRDGDRSSYRSRDDEQRSSSRYGNDRNDRRSGDRDNRGRSSDRFSRDGQREERRSFRGREEDRDKRNYDDKPKRERRSTVLDSDIMREIVQKRRATGRSSHKQKVLSLAWSEERGPIRLNKYISNSGICSRREADQLIIAGAVTVNGVIVTELGTKVLPTDEVRYEDKVLQREKPVYILLNKPKDYITTTEDDRDRDNVMMLIEGACPERVYPVGRLDRNSTGLLLFTNDGEMAKKLTHPRYGIKKIYQVELDRNMSLADFETLANGVELSDGFIKPDEIAFVEGQKNIIGITLHSGKNRVVRRMFDHLGYEVEKLDRVYYAGLTKKDLPRGEWRFLRPEEINILKMSL